MKENIKEISEVPRPSSAPETEFETEANLVTVTFFFAHFYRTASLVLVHRCSHRPRLAFATSFFGDWIHLVVHNMHPRFGNFQGLPRC